MDEKLTDFQIIELMKKHMLVWAWVGTTEMCYIFDDIYHQHNINPLQAQRLIDSGMIKAFPPDEEGGEIIQWTLSSVGWEVLFSRTTRAM